MHKVILVRSLVGFATLATLAALVLSGCSTSSSTSASSPHTASTSVGQVVAVPGYQVSVFAKGTQSYFAPDAVIDDGTHIFIDYQNTTAKDCSDAAKANSTIVEYTLQGTVIKTFNIPGHSDGMREDPSSHLLWVTSCEDGNPRFVTVDPTSGTITPYTFSPTPHGGGYDDLYFVNGMAFVAASNPNLNSAGVNVFPAIDEMSISGGTVTLKPILMGDASAMDLTTKTMVKLNEIDPDSLTVDPQGDLVLVNQAGSELVFISNPGTAQQSVSRLLVGDQLDDTVFATKAGRLLVTDGVANISYWIRGTFVANTTNHYLYTEAPDDSGTASFIGTIDPSTGLVTPVVIGLVHPTGMIFVAD